MIQARPIFDRLTALADPTRSRLLLLLDRHELTVGELCVGAPASAEHREPAPQDARRRRLGLGARRRYEPPLYDVRRRRSTRRRASSGSSCATRSAPRRPRGRISCAPNACSRSAARRRRRSSPRRAGQWDRVRAELYGARTDLVPLAALLDPTSVVGDLGCGTGQTSAALAPFVARVLAVDESSAMLAAARERVGASRERRAAQRTTRGASDRRRARSTSPCCRSCCTSSSIRRR